MQGAHAFTPGSPSPPHYSLLLFGVDGTVPPLQGSRLGGGEGEVSIQAQEEVNNFHPLHLLPHSPPQPLALLAQLPLPQVHGAISLSYRWDT